MDRQWKQRAKRGNGRKNECPVGMSGSFQGVERLRHTIQFVDELTSSHAKPDGVVGCEVWVKVGDPAPADASALKYLATDTLTPYTVDYDGADAGKIAYYMLRWVNTRGEQGPWSQTVSATIGA